MGPTQPPTQYVPAGVKIKWSYTSSPPYALFSATVFRNSETLATLTEVLMTSLIPVEKFHDITSIRIQLPPSKSLKFTVH